VQNNLQYIAAANLQPAVFQVMYQVKMLTTAVLSVVILRKSVRNSVFGLFNKILSGRAMRTVYGHKCDWQRYAGHRTGRAWPAWFRSGFYRSMLVCHLILLRSNAADLTRNSAELMPTGDRGPIYDDVTFTLGSAMLTTLPSRVASEWADYKLGDALKGWQRKSLGKKTLFIEFCCDKYPGSIVCDYRRNTKKYNDIPTLAKIVRRRGQLYHTKPTGCHSLPGPNKTVVHLRLGDVGEEDRHYIKNLSYYSGLVRKELVVVTNIQRTRLRKEDHSKKVDESLEYIRRFLDQMAAQNSSVTFRTDCLADEDFVYIAHAKHFIGSGGGYSQFLHRVQETLRTDRT